MSYYGVSVIITLLTSLIAFYLLYKAKELNLGIIISISIGSVILGFTFSPAFNAVLDLLSNNINKKLALVLSLLTVLFVFLLFILIISFIVSICIPKKVAAIDCCVVINRLLSKISIKSIKDKIVTIFRKIATGMRKTVKNVYNIKNKLKKPVDTKQIIDTMGIEKSKKGFSYKESSEATDTSDTFAFSKLLGFMEPSSEVACENKDQCIAIENVNQEVEATDSVADIAYQEIATTQSSDFETEAIEEDINDLYNLEEITIKVNIEDQAFENLVTDEEIIEVEFADGEIPEEVIPESNQIMPSITENTVALAIDANSLVLKAFESKDEGRKEEAIGQYIEALQHEPNNEMIFWIVLDICALYKQLGLGELAKNILEGLVSEYGSLIQPEIKMEIINNLK